MTGPPMMPRLRGAVVGSASALTGVGAHAAASGVLPDTGLLLMVAATALALGLSVASAPQLRVVPSLIGGQLIVHVISTLASGHHDDMVTAPMGVMHALGTVAALALVCGAELLVRAAAGLARRTIGLRFSPRTPQRVLVTPTGSAVVPTALLFLGGIGLRGPPSI